MGLAWRRGTAADVSPGSDPDNSRRGGAGGAFDAAGAGGGAIVAGFGATGAGLGATGTTGTTGATRGATGAAFGAAEIAATGIGATGIALGATGTAFGATGIGAIGIGETGVGDTGIGRREGTGAEPAATAGGTIGFTGDRGSLEFGRCGGTSGMGTPEPPPYRIVGGLVHRESG